MDNIKSCPKCKQVKELTAFHRRGEVNYASWCKQCCADYEKVRWRTKTVKYTRPKPIKIPPREEFLIVLKAI